jgi:hypothetical protein
MSQPTPIYDAEYDYANGALGAQTYSAGNLSVPPSKQYNYERLAVTVAQGKASMAALRIGFVDIYSQAQSHGYGNVLRIRNHGDGGVSGDYIRAEGMAGSTGPVIAHKTAVRGPELQWAVWGYQVAMGPGAKAAMWVHGDQAGAVVKVPHVFVVSGELDAGAVIHWNAQPNSSGVLFRVYRGTELTSELTADAVLRVRRIEYLP